MAQFFSEFGTGRGRVDDNNYFWVFYVGFLRYGSVSFQECMRLNNNSCRGVETAAVDSVEVFMMPSVMHFVIFSFSLLGSSCIEPDYYWR